MANETTNVLAALRALLLADATVTGLVRNRIRTAHVADGEALPIDYPFVILAPIGGAGRYNGQVMNTAVEVLVYSKVSVSECLDVYQAVYAVLQAGRLYRDGITTRGVIRESDRPREGFNDGLVAWYTRSTYDVISAA
jgi:hypothetical protein